MYPDVNNLDPDDGGRQSGWRAALGLKLAMLGVLALVLQANMGIPTAGVDTDAKGVPAAMLVLSRGI